MQPFNPAYFNAFKASILAHNWQSGEIMISICTYEGYPNTSELIAQFFEQEAIHCQSADIPFTPISKNDALTSIAFGLSTKVNYTEVGLEFSPQEQKKYAFGFLNFFNNPQYYTIDTDIWQQVDLSNHYYQRGGALLIDSKQIGLFWVNDIY